MFYNKDSQIMLKIFMIQLLAVFGTVLTATYKPNNRAQFLSRDEDLADSSFRWRLAPDDGGSTRNNGKQGSLDVKGLYKRVLLDLGRDKVLLETENGCTGCNLQIDHRTLGDNDSPPILPDRFQDTRRTSTILDESTRFSSSTSDETAGRRVVPFAPYSLNVGEVRTVKLQNGDKIRITASKPAQPRPFPPMAPQHFPSRSGGPPPSFSPKISGAPTKKGLIQIGPNMYIRVTANKPAPPPHSSVLQSRIQQDRLDQSLEPLPPVTRPPLTPGVYNFYATTEQPCEVQENELPLSPGFATGSVHSGLDVLTDLNTRTNLPVSPFAITKPSSSSGVTSRLSETSEFTSKSKLHEAAERPTGHLPVSPFPSSVDSNKARLPVSPFATGSESSRTDSRFSEQDDSQQGQRTSGLPVSPFPSSIDSNKARLPVSPFATDSESSRTDSRFSEQDDSQQGQRTSGLPVSPFPSTAGAAGGKQASNGKQDVIESNTVEISPGRYVRVNATRGPSAAPGEAPSRGYIPPYRSLAPPTRPPLTQGVADQYEQSSQGAKSAEGSASDPNKKLIQVGPGKYIRVTAQKDPQKS